mmetsp:Transcript_95740/g.309084  ORF Transcript_95740/g.309084 Transcript_95740/m.309084 type:complete len:386 (+) Transcript_95740:86-1243(+)
MALQRLGVVEEKASSSPLVADSFTQPGTPKHSVGADAEDDDLLYGSALFHRLPDWMASTDLDEEDEEDAPYGGKLAEWMVGSNYDAETTSLASDMLAELSSGSDDESRSSAKSPCDTAGALSPVATLACQPCTMSGEATFAEQEEQGLVDLDPEEGHRRGAELMQLLMQKPGAATDSGPRSVAGASAAGAQPGLSPACLSEARGSAKLSQPPQAALGLPGCHWALPPAEPMSSACLSVCGEAQTAYAAAVSEAATRAFGSSAVDVASSASGGFVIWLRGWPAAELQNNERAVLAALNQALCPLLGPDVVGVEPRTATATGARLSGVASAVAGTRLTIWHLRGEAEYAQNYCWQYVRQGICPRGGYCRWLHAVPPSYPIDIEVAAA